MKVSRSIYMRQQQERHDSRKSDGRNKQTIGGRGPKSLSRRDVSGVCKLLDSGALTCSGH